MLPLHRIGWMNLFRKMHWPRFRAIGVQVAPAVNLLMVVGVSGFLVFDYYRETHQRMDDKVVALREQALTIHQGVVRLKNRPAAELQDFIDGVCGQVSESDSPGHHIVVEIDGRVMQAQAHRRDSARMYQTLLTAMTASHHGDYTGEKVIVGAHREAGVNVYVGVQIANVVREIRNQVLLRSVGVVLFGLALALGVNVAIRKVVVKPLRRLVRTIDQIRAGHLGVQADNFKSAELTSISEAINFMSRSLAETEQRRQHSLAKARSIQQNLLPTAVTVPGVSLAALHQPAEEVAGDYYDFLPMPDGTFLLCIADVVGHGVPAAMMAAMLKVLLMQEATVADLPGKILGRINRQFMAVSLPDDFVSLSLARWDPRTRALQFASAGHEPTLFLSGRSPVKALLSTGPLIGLMEEACWETKTIPVETGDLLLCLTDGVTEAQNAMGEPVGRPRLAQWLEQNRCAAPSETLKRLDQFLQEFRGCRAVLDDYTLVALAFA